MAQKRKIIKSPVVRALLIGLGFVAVGLGGIGIVLPGIPTTPFLLLALWAFSLSSRRFRVWLLSHPWFGRSIRNWNRYRVVPVKAKALAAISMSGSWIWFWWSESLAFWPLLLIGVFFIVVLTFLFSMPSKAPGSPGGDVMRSNV